MVPHLNQGRDSLHGVTVQRFLRLQAVRAYTMPYPGLRYDCFINCGPVFPSLSLPDLLYGTYVLLTVIIAGEVLRNAFLDK